MPPLRSSGAGCRCDTSCLLVSFSGCVHKCRCSRPHSFSHAHVCLAGFPRCWSAALAQPFGFFSQGEACRRQTSTANQTPEHFSFLFLDQVLSCIPMCLSSVYKEKALGDDDMDVIYLNGWVAVFQFMSSLLFAVPSAYAMGLPVSVRVRGKLAVPPDRR